MTNTLFIITARGGSKGLPKKNIKPLLGKPLIQYSIEQAREFVKDEWICLSSDDKNIIEVGTNLGLNVPFVRPKELATDEAGSFEVIKHAVNHYEQNGKKVEQIVLLQPTSPLRKAIHIKEALELYSEELDMVISVEESQGNPYFSLFEEDNDGFLKKSINSDFQRRQDAPTTYKSNGAVYVINPKSLNKFKSLAHFQKVKKYVMHKKYSFDIDDEIDWLICESILKSEI